MIDRPGAFAAVCAGLGLTLLAPVRAQVSGGAVAPGTENPALRRFGDAIAFYAGFDETVAAEITSGAPLPAPDGWDRTPDGRMRGFIGNTRRELATNSLAYKLGDDFRMSNGGTLLIWVCLLERLAAKDVSYYWPIRIEAGELLLLMGRMGVRANRKALYAAMCAQGGGKIIGEVSMGSTAEWKAGEWHLLAVAWRNDSMAFSVDGAMSGRKEFKTATLRTRCTKGMTLKVGGGASDRFIVDEPMLLNIPLGPEDVAWLHRKSLDGRSDR